MFKASLGISAKVFISPKISEYKNLYNKMIETDMHTFIGKRFGTIVTPALLVLLLMSPQVTQASEDWSLSGYGSFGGGKINRDDLLLGDYDDSWNYEFDSVLGIQAMGRLWQAASITAQVVARGFNYDNKGQFEPDLEWLFLSYDWSSSSRFRLGRLRVPYYFFSTSIEAGYTYPWVRPPIDVYALATVPFNHFDGIDFTHYKAFSDFETEAQLFGGVQKGEYLGSKVSIDAMFGGAILVTWNELTLRYSGHRVHLDLDIEGFQPLIQGFEVLAAQTPIFQEVADSLSLQGGWYFYQGLSARWEPSTWQFLFEYYDASGPGEDYSTHGKGWYVSAAKTIRKVSLYGVAGRSESLPNGDTAKLLAVSERFIPVGTNAQVDQLRAGAAYAMQRNIIAQHSYTLGIRYDVIQSVAIKLEGEYLDLDQGSSGQLLLQGDGPAPESVSLISFSIDFIF